MQTSERRKFRTGALVALFLGTVGLVAILSFAADAPPAGVPAAPQPAGPGAAIPNQEN